VQLFFLVVALYSLQLAPGRAPNPATMTARQLESWVWIHWMWRGLHTASAALAVNSVLGVRDRRLIRRLIEAEASRRSYGTRETDTHI
jgi:hypothetical protein